MIFKVVLLTFLIFIISLKFSQADEFWPFAVVTCTPELNHFSIKGLRIHADVNSLEYSSKVPRFLENASEDIRKKFKNNVIEFTSISDEYRSYVESDKIDMEGDYRVIGMHDNRVVGCKLKNSYIEYKIDTFGDMWSTQLVKMWRDKDPIVSLRVFNSDERDFESVSFLEYKNENEICLKGSYPIKNDKKSLTKSSMKYFSSCFELKGNRIIDLRFLRTKLIK